MWSGNRRSSRSARFSISTWYAGTASPRSSAPAQRLAPGPAGPGPHPLVVLAEDAGGHDLRGDRVHEFRDDLVERGPPAAVVAQPPPGRLPEGHGLRHHGVPAVSPALISLPRAGAPPAGGRGTRRAAAVSAKAFTSAGKAPVESSTYPQTLPAQVSGTPEGRTPAPATRYTWVDSPTRCTATSRCICSVRRWYRTSCVLTPRTPARSRRGIPGRSSTTRSMRSWSSCSPPPPSGIGTPAGKYSFLLPRFCDWISFSRSRPPGGGGTGVRRAGRIVPPRR